MLVVGGDEDYVAPNVWGWVGSGILFVAPDDSFLLAFRSDEVRPPSVWGVPGGQVPLEARGSIEDIRLSAETEVAEEFGEMPPDARYLGLVVLYPDDFPQQLRAKQIQFEAEGRYPQYYLFRYDVSAETAATWEPDLEESEGAWENDEYAWVTLCELESKADEEVLPGLVKEVTKLVAD